MTGINRIAHGVAHIDLAAPAALQELPSGNWLVVLWLNDRPVGQGYLDVEKTRPLNIGQFVRSAVDPVAEAMALGAPAAVATGAVGHPRTSATVVICTRDRPDTLAACLRSLARQTHPPEEIVVVDNASRDDRTRSVAEAAHVRYVFEPRPGLDIARNTGARLATGEVVAYTDDDVLLHARWLERLVAAFDQPALMAVTGLVLPAELNTDAQRRFELFWSLGRGYRRIDFDTAFFAVDRTHGCPAWEIGAGASMAFRRKCFEAVGLFDERLDVGAAGCSGDSEYWHRVLSTGFTCRYEPSAVAFHVHRRDIEGFERQIFNYMRGHAAALLVQFERTGNWGNVRRLMVSLPMLFLRRALKRIFRLGDEGDDTLRQEVQGYLSGIGYYLKTPRPFAGDKP